MDRVADKGGMPGDKSGLLWRRRNLDGDTCFGNGSIYGAT